MPIAERQQQRKAMIIPGRRTYPERLNWRGEGQQNLRPNNSESYLVMTNTVPSEMITITII